MREAIKKFLPQNFNDLLTLGALVMIPALWVLQGKGVITTQPEVTGALIVTWSLIFQFYYRKAKDE
jgi:hypothetical protein